MFELYHRDARQSQLSLTQALELSRNRGYSEKRDKVFALMSVVQTEQRIPINYKCGLADLFDACISILNRIPKRWNHDKIMRDLFEALFGHGLHAYSQFKRAKMQQSRTRRGPDVSRQNTVKLTREQKQTMQSLLDRSKRSSKPTHGMVFSRLLMDSGFKVH